MAIVLYIRMITLLPLELNRLGLTTYRSWVSNWIFCIKIFQFSNFYIKIFHLQILRSFRRALVTLVDLGEDLETNVTILIIFVMKHWQ
jgi:hypothetical protein